MACRVQPSTMVKLNKTRDQCRQRKIRCIVPEKPPGMRATCSYCSSRGQPCNFSIFRRKIRVTVPETLPATTHSSSQSALGEMFIDRVLQYGPQSIVLHDEGSVFTVPNDKVLSSNLAFFSETKVVSLAEKIGNDHIRTLIERLDAHILARQGGAENGAWPPIQFQKSEEKPNWCSPNQASSYIQAYFKNLHPVYPFLDREEFEAQAFSPRLTGILEANPAFSALYHAILALGNQYMSGGTFEPGKGESWSLFQVALGHMADVILPRRYLENVQALVAMSIFAMNNCGLQVDDALITEAARMVIMLKYHKNLNSEPKHLRAFWVIYALEKQQTITSRSCSIIPDEDIGCVIPPFPEAQAGGFNWFISLVRISRIGSVAYTQLFSISAWLKTTEKHLAAIRHIQRLFEEWKESIPEEYRPEDSAHFPTGASPSTTLSALQIHFSYYYLVIGLERLALHLNRDGGSKGQAQKSKQRLMSTAKAIVELTKYIDIQPHTPMFILGVVPTSAVFILFDFVIHNPDHHCSRGNLVLLDTAAGYFSLLGIASNNELPGHILAEFAQIAREYYWKTQQAKVMRASTQAEKKVKVVEDGPPQQPTGQLMAPEKLGDAYGNNFIMDTSASAMDINLGPQATPTPSEYLEYPIPMNFEAASDFQTSDSRDLRTMFGWSFPEFGELDTDFALGQDFSG